ncbi:uncharacterized protein LOC131151175 [Malania oleifera]|uniref:uncharacterized protein LOC131151175 n=1 Tax=Malania oleifera TaxID=397392 RepID=UPI0025AE256A|nr:uncharacterized protein LOC131151175 [Malania oleifera]
MWLELKEHFSQGNGPLIFELQTAISALCQNQSDARTYFTDLKFYVMTFLIGLNDVFDNVRGQILMMDPLPSINKAFFLIIQEERQRVISHCNLAPVSVESVALATKSENSFKNFKGNTRSRLLCSHYGITGHIVDKCYKLHGYPPHYKFKDRNKDGSTSVNSVQQTFVVDDNSSTHMSLTAKQYQQLMALLKPHSSSTTIPSANMALLLNFSGNITSFCLAAHSLTPYSWIIDSGASDHMDLATWKMIGTSELQDGLYRLTTSNSSSDLHNASSITCVSIQSNKSGSASITIMVAQHHIKMDLEKHGVELVEGNHQAFITNLVLQPTLLERIKIAQMQDAELVKIRDRVQSG